MDEPLSEKGLPSIDEQGYHEGCPYTGFVVDGTEGKVWCCNKCGRGGLVQPGLRRDEAGHDHGEVLNDLWSAERCVWRIEHHGGDGAWVVLLEWTQEYDNQHHADWTTYTWQFYGDTVDEALSGAVEWCEGLWPWRRCDACDGQGWWGRASDPTPCDECHLTGLASAEWSR